MYRFDGAKWKTTGFHAAEGGTISGAVDLSSVFGFSATNIYAVGARLYTNYNPPPNILDSSLIIHFDGNQWKEEAVMGRSLQTIWGIDPSHVWAGGRYGTLFFFDGQKWKPDTLPMSPPPGTFWAIGSIAGTSADKVYLTAYAIDNQTGKEAYYFLQHTSSGWSLLDTFVIQAGMIQNKWGTGTLWVSPEGTLYSGGGGVFRWDEISWKKILDTGDAGQSVFGMSEKNLFVPSLGTSSRLFHFNGSDWFQIQGMTQPTIALRSGWADGDEAFVVGFTLDAAPMKSVVFHGK